jgi:hypothetical protein
VAVADLTVERLETDLAAHASSAGEVFPSALGLIQAESHWSGRLWEVAGAVMVDQETMRFLAGGNRPDEVAACAARWAESELSVNDIRMVVACGGYDPEPFEALDRAGILRTALYVAEDTPRMVKGERAGVWISDELALLTDEEVVERIGAVMAVNDP